MAVAAQSKQFSVAWKSYVGAQVGFDILMCLFTTEGLDTLHTTFLFIYSNSTHTHTHIQMLEMVLGICIHII